MSLASPQQAAFTQAKGSRGDSGRAAQALAALTSLLSQAGPERDAQFTLPVSAPGSVEAALELDDQAVYWLSRNDELIVGLGVAREFQLAPQSSAGDAAAFAPLKEQASAVLSASVCGSLAGALAERPRAFGGLAFQPGRASRAPWKAFGDGAFQIPRFCVVRRAGAWSLSLFIRNDEQHNAEALLEQALGLAAKLPMLREPTSQVAREVSTKGADPQPFTALVSEILGRIESGSCTKVVAALRAEIAFEHALSVPATLGQLKRNHLSTVFAFKRGDFTFCGATPERLVKKDGLEIQTEALAGTFKRTETDYRTELLRSPKEHQEHQPVLAAITGALQPLCRDLTFPSQPELCELPHLLHLKTPIRGHLNRETHILSLVGALHPTPAVGGVPRRAAISFIAEREVAERGWYAGPIGWFDGNGDGEFCVALRSGMLNQERAYLFAGAGIVSGSVPETEFAETQLKLRSLRACLRH